MAVFTYQRRVLPPRNRFLITDQAGKPVFSVVRSLPYWERRFSLTDTTGAVVAETRRVWPSFPPAVEVSSGGRVVVTVKRLFGLPPRFALPELDCEVQCSLGLRQMTVVDGSGLAQAHFSRRLTGLKWTWTVETSGSIPDAELLAIALSMGTGRRRNR